MWECKVWRWNQSRYSSHFYRFLYWAEESAVRAEEGSWQDFNVSWFDFLHLSSAPHQTFNLNLFSQHSSAKLWSFGGFSRLAVPPYLKKTVIKWIRIQVINWKRNVLDMLSKALITQLFFFLFLCPKWALEQSVLWLKQPGNNGRISNYRWEMLKDD